MKTVAVIPAYNVEGSIEDVVRRTRRFVDEVFVVDDGSTDRTAYRAGRGGAEVIRQPKNTGKAEAIRAGFSRCSDYDIVVTLDSDLQHMPEEIPDLIACIEAGNDMCIGSRFLNSDIKIPFFRRFSNVLVSSIISIFTKQNITDPQSGFRAINCRRLGELELKAERYAIEHVMILEAAEKNFKIGEVPISCIYGGEQSHIRPVRDTLRVIYDILKFIFQRS